MLFPKYGKELHNILLRIVAIIHILFFAEAHLKYKLDLFKLKGHHIKLMCMVYRVKKNSLEPLEYEYEHRLNSYTTKSNILNMNNDSRS